MPHADSSLVPSSIQTKEQLWDHVYTQLKGLLDGQREWVTNLANASSLIFNSLSDFPECFGTSKETAVNWCGFYIDSAYFPKPRLTRLDQNEQTDRLLLGPFCGKPACQFISIIAGKARGVCADSYIKGQTVLVPQVDLYPGHIACDGETKSEIVVPLKWQGEKGSVVVGVLDLDCLALEGFDEADRVGLERIAHLVVNACDW